MKTYREGTEISFAWKHERAGKPRAFTVEYIGNVLQKGDVVATLNDAIAPMFEVTSDVATFTSPDGDAMPFEGLTPYIAKVLGHSPFLFKCFGSMIHSNAEQHILFSAIEYRTNIREDGTLDTTQPSYHSAKYSTPFRYSDSIAQVIGTQVVLTEEFYKLWQKVERILPVSMRLSAYKMNKGKGKVINFARWFTFIMTGKELTQAHIKEIANAVSGTTYYGYRTSSDMTYLALAVYERSNTRSCMYEPLHQHPNDWDSCYEVEDTDSELQYCHPFDSYSVTDSGNALLLVSKEPPEALDRKLVGEFPFVARAFSWNGRCFTRSYGVEDSLDILEDLGFRQDDDPRFKLKLFINTAGNYICPFVDGADHVYAESEHTECYMVDKKCITYSYGYTHRELDYRYKFAGGSGTLESADPYYECAVSWESFPEEDFVFVDDLNDYVHHRFATFVNDEYRLDGVEVLRYMNRTYR